MTIRRLFIFILLLLVSTSLHAQRFNNKSVYDDLRHGQWEASLFAAGTGGVDLVGDLGSSIELDDTWGWGFSIGYNLNAKWNFAYRFSLSKPDYTAVVIPTDEDGNPLPVDPQVIDHELDRYAHQLNATWHWFDGPLTPFLQAGIGYTTLDTNIPSAPPATGCWWDPWWGWICNTQWKTYDTSEFSYNLGLGVRWDINGALFLRGSYSREWVDVKAGSLEFDTLGLDVGLMW